jgi:predicted membrane channel-forming protein YqfA (hemolysin III family)
MDYHLIGTVLYLIGSIMYTAGTLFYLMAIRINVLKDNTTFLE